MKNTYLVAILFLIAGLVIGQFLNLNINNQSARTIDSQSKDNILFQVKKSDLENMKPLEKFEVVIPGQGINNRPYACWSEAGGITIDGDGDDSGTIDLWGYTWGCYALSYNWA